MGIGTPAMSAFTTWLCLRIWGVTFLQESFCQAVYGPEHGLGAQVSEASAGEEPHLAQASSSIHLIQHNRFYGLAA